MNEKTLSETIHMEDIKAHYMNLVNAPVGCGKTYWALNVLAKCASAPSKVLYLIDTINGRRQLIAQNDVSPYSDEWYYVVNDDMAFYDEDCISKTVVMTYGKFGKLVEQNRDFGIQFEYIICDEIHNLPHFSAFKVNAAINYHIKAQWQLEDIIRNTDTIVIGLTATPERVQKHMRCVINQVRVDSNVRRLTTEETHTYTNLVNLLSEQSKEETGILYIERIEKMKEIWTEAADMGFSVIAVWSPNNKDYPLTEEQKDVLSYIVKEQSLPSQYNLFLINASCETSINIFSPVDYIIVHKREDEAQIQVRGRYRNNLKRLYYLDYSKLPEFPVSSMGKRLYADERRSLCRLLNLRNESGRLCMWSTVERKLMEAGYQVKNGKDKIGRYRIVTH